MQISSNHIFPTTPWTEMGDWSDDRPPFSCIISSDIDKARDEIIFKVEITVHDKILDGYLYDGALACYLHVECSDTRYRNAHYIPYEELREYRVSHPVNDFYKSVETTILFVATDDIIGFFYHDLGPEGGVRPRDYEKGSIAGYSCTCRTTINRTFDSIVYPESPFVLVPGKSDDMNMRINYNEEQIQIVLQPDEYKKVRNLQKRKEVVRNIQSIYLPQAIMSAVDAAKTNPDEYENYLWYRTLDAKLREQGYPNGMRDSELAEAELYDVTNLLLRDIRNGTFVQSDAISYLDKATYGDADEEED